MYFYFSSVSKDKDSSHKKNLFNIFEGKVAYIDPTQTLYW